MNLSAATLGELQEQLASLDGDESQRGAGFAAEAILAFAARVGLSKDCVEEGPATAISDLLGNMRHLARLLRLDYGKLDQRGAEYESAEGCGGFVYDPLAVFLDLFGDPRLAPTEMGFALNCHEINALVGLLEAKGRDVAASEWRSGHLDACKEKWRHLS